MQHTTELDETASPPAHQIAQPSTQPTRQKILFPFGPLAEDVPPSNRQRLRRVLKQANSAVNMATVSDILYESIWGSECSAKTLRALYKVPEGGNLRRTLAVQSPLLYSALRDAEARLCVWIQTTMVADADTDLGTLYFNAKRVGDFCKKHTNTFLSNMATLFPGVDYDAITDEHTPVEADEEDCPF